MNVQLFIPCFVDQLYPETAMNMVKVLEKLGCKLSYNPNQTCCGQPAFNAGYWEETTAVAKKFIQDFEGLDYIVAPSGSCTGFVRNFYERLFENTNNLSASEKVGQRLYEFTEFLVDVLKVTDVGAKLEGRATYHDACGALRECGIKSPTKAVRTGKRIGISGNERV